MTSNMTPAKRITDLIHSHMPSSTSSGFYIEDIRLPEVVCVLPFKEKFLRPGNTISGPTLMMLADVAMYGLVLSLDAEQIMAVTQDLHMHFLARPEAVTLEAIATLVKRGRRTIVMRVDLYTRHPDGSRKLVAFATGSYAVISTSP